MDSPIDLLTIQDKMHEFLKKTAHIYLDMCCVYVNITAISEYIIIS